MKEQNVKIGGGGTLCKPGGVAQKWFGPFVPVTGPCLKLVSKITPDLIWENGVWQYIVRRVVPSIPRPYEGQRVTKIRHFPLMLKYESSGGLAWPLYYRGCFEPFVLKTISDHLSPGMFFIDIGANCGLHTLIGSRKVGESGRVLAFEPQPDLCRLIKENLNINKITNTQVNNCALAETKGTLNLCFPDGGRDTYAALDFQSGNSMYPTIPVDVDTLSDVCGDLAENAHRYGMKIDVEGAEMRVLRGARRLFDKKRPSFVTFECCGGFLNRFGDSDEQLIDFFKEYDYELSAMVNHRWVPFDGYDSYKKHCGNSTELLAKSRQ